MIQPQFTIKQFRTSAAEKLSFLEAKGFVRAHDLEETTGTGSSVVYLGRNLGFVFSFDLRDQCVDGQVVKVDGGRMKRNWEGGYSSDIYVYLVRLLGYRGKVSRSGAPDESELDRMLNGWADLLKGAGSSLLTDQRGLLPR